MGLYQKRIFKNAQSYLEGFGIDFEQYKEDRIDGEIELCVTWVHKESGKELSVTGVYADEKGRILQAGNNYDSLIY